MTHNKTHLTAIKRNKPSAPLQHLLSKNLISKNHLDYGCGKGDDANYLNKLNFPTDSYDPYYNPTPLTKKYLSITCTYVLNVLPTEKERLETVLKCLDLLNWPYGTAYFTVRKDLKTDTKTQFLIHSVPYCTLLFQNSKFAIFSSTPFSSSACPTQPFISHSF